MRPYIEAMRPYGVPPITICRALMPGASQAPGIRVAYASVTSKSDLQRRRDGHNGPWGHYEQLS